MKNLRERLIDPDSPDRRPRRAAYALPTFFTAGNVFLGFYALMESFRGAMATAAASGTAPQHFAAGLDRHRRRGFSDGLDGRIARMTNTVSDFGREMDSLADVITFGIAPRGTGIRLGPGIYQRSSASLHHRTVAPCRLLLRVPLSLMWSDAPRALHVVTNPVPKNPGRPDRKYFVGMPIPSAAAAVAAIIYAADSTPLRFMAWSTAWLALLGLLSFLMVSTWRYPSFKDLNLVRPQSPISFVIAGAAIYLIWTVSAARSAGDGGLLRRKRDRDPDRRTDRRQLRGQQPPQPGPRPHTEQHPWLKRLNNASRSSAAIRCWLAKFEKCSTRRRQSRACY
ncbi:MAG: CDP-alcohol phosphatidyltransferase family protein [Acidobacteriota bacterium]